MGLAVSLTLIVSSSQYISFSCNLYTRSQYNVTCIPKNTAAYVWDTLTFTYVFSCDCSCMCVLACMRLKGGCTWGIFIIFFKSPKGPSFHKTPVLTLRTRQPLSVSKDETGGGKLTPPSDRVKRFQTFP